MPELTHQDMIKMAEVAEFTQQLAARNDVLEITLQKQAAERNAYAARLPEIVDSMIESGVLEYHQKSAALQALQSPVSMLRFMQKLARKVGPVHLGAPATGRSNPDSMDEFTRFILGD